MQARKGTLAEQPAQMWDSANLQEDTSFLTTLINNMQMAENAPRALQNMRTNKVKKSTVKE